MSEAVSDLARTPWRWIVLIWCAAGLFDASQTVMIMHAEGRHHPWPPLFAVELALWLPWMLATPLIIMLARRHPLFPGPTWRGAALHFGLFAAVSLVAEAWSSFLQVQFNPWNNRIRPTFWDTLAVSLLFQVLTFLIAYALILAVTFAVDTRVRAARLNGELSKAQLAALRGQIEPHFIFNTLNSIAGQVRDRRNDEAVSMIVGLSEFLRRASEDAYRAQVTLAEEVDYLQRYLDIQKMRFGERLRVSIDIPEELLGAAVPNLLLQPLAENAIKHGISRRIAGGAVRIAGVRDGNRLKLTVYNDGPAPTADEPERNGVGIANLRTRLDILYGAESGLTLAAAAPDGVEAAVFLPFRER